MKSKHLFWDFDGTLYDSYPQVLRAMQDTLTSFGIPQQPPQELLGLLKHSVYYTICHYAQPLGLEPQQMLQAFRLRHQQEGHFPPYEGLKKCLTTLHQAGVRHYLYTHRDNQAWQQLEQDGLRSLFADGITAEDGFPHKPAPDALLCLMERNHLSPKDCAMIGDRDIDLLSGQNAGMAGILFDPDNFFPDFSAQGRVRSMDELCRWVLS